MRTMGSIFGAKSAPRSNTSTPSVYTFSSFERPASVSSTINRSRALNRSEETNVGAARTRLNSARTSSGAGFASRSVIFSGVSYPSLLPPRFLLWLFHSGAASDTLVPAPAGLLAGNRFPNWPRRSDQRGAYYGPRNQTRPGRDPL